jgi:parvulin-like peptidyl-prolyl isomerase
MLPRELPPGPLAEVARSFGSEFAERVAALAPGEWAGPVESPYGLHLVLVSERVAPARPALAELRPAVERELLAERRRDGLQALYEQLLQKYTVSIEMPKPQPEAQTASAAGSGSAAR